MTARQSVAIVHERWTEIGGSENVIGQLAREWADAPVIVPFATPESIPADLDGRLVTTFVDRLHRIGGRRAHAPLLPLVPAAMRDPVLARSFHGKDAVIISHHAMAISAVAAAHAADVPSVVYVHSPARWAWDPAMRAGEATSILGRTALSALSWQARRVEAGNAAAATTIVANSTFVAERIAQWWGRSSVVVHPPVDVERFAVDHSAARGDYFLLAGRLVPYKRPELAVAAATRAGVRLVVAGDGRMMEACRSVAGPNVEFRGRVSDAELVSLQQRARALLMPGVEDFGIVPVEAMACGTPVVAVGEGGACDTVQDGVTGLLLAPGSDEAVIEQLAAVLRQFGDEFDPQQCSKHAKTFSNAAFRAQMRAVVSGL